MAPAKSAWAASPPVGSFSATEKKRSGSLRVSSLPVTVKVLLAFAPSAAAKLRLAGLEVKGPPSPVTSQVRVRVCVGAGPDMVTV